MWIYNGREYDNHRDYTLAKRLDYLVMIESGVSRKDIISKLGINRRTLNEWKNGREYKGVHIAPLSKDNLFPYRDKVKYNNYMVTKNNYAVKESPYNSRYLSPKEREQIFLLSNDGLNYSEIAKEIGRNRKTIAREIKRIDGDYSPYMANLDFVGKLRRDKLPKIEKYPNVPSL
jgi:DNA-binding CsgD family transcriptional regulator